VKGSASRLLIDMIRTAYERLGFHIVDDEAFSQLVLARIVEPTSNPTALESLTNSGPIPNTAALSLGACSESMLIRTEKPSLPSALTIRSQQQGSR
jgi:hypothetical protein